MLGHNSSHRSVDLSPRVTFGLGLLIATGSVLLRWRLLSVPLERDEGEYAYIGWLMLQGVPPYAEAYTMKLPGIHTIYAGLLWLFGHSTEGIRIGLIAFNLTATGLMYLLGRDLFSRLAGVAAAAVYAVLSLGPAMHGFMANAEHFLLTPVLLGLWLLLRFPETYPLRAVFAAGLCGGLAVLIKQQAALFLGFGVIWITATWLQRRVISPAKFCGLTAVFLSGPALLYGATCLTMLAAGTFENFWRWTVIYPRDYVSQVSWSEGGELLLRTGIPIAIFAGPVLLLAVVGIVASLRGPGRGTGGVFLAGFILFSFLAVCPGLYFREHYFLLMLPAVALAAASAIDAWRRTLSQSRFLAAPLAVTMACLAYCLYVEQDILFRLPPNQISRLMYGENPFVESPAIAARIRQTTSPSDRIAILGSEPQILFHAQRRSATGFLYMYPMTEQHRLAEGMQREMIAEIELAAPELLVVVTVPTSWLYDPASPHVLLDWMNREVPQHYEIAALLPIGAENPAEFLSGKQAEAAAPQFPVAVKVMRRRDP